MRNLLRANFARLWRSKIFYLFALMLLLLQIGIMLNFSRQAMADTSDYVYHLEQHYFDMGAFEGIFLSAFIALFIGTEYSDGVLRNKLVVGATRTKVYLSNLIVCAASSIVLVTVWMVGGMVGIPALGMWSIGVWDILMATLVSVLAAMALSAVFLLVAMLLTNRAATAVVCMFLSLVLILAASYVYNHLCEPELSSGMVITMEGGLQMMDPTPNPAYVAEPLRSIYLAIVNMLPTGQMVLMSNILSNEGFSNYPLQIVGSILFTVLSTGVGLALFHRKDIK